MNENDDGWLNRSSLLESLATAATSDHPGNILLSGPWGSGKTHLLRELCDKMRECSSDTAPHVLWFSPWDTAADGDARMAFLRLLRDELKPVSEQCDDKRKSLVSPLMKMLEDLLASKPAKGALTALSGGMLGGHEAFVLGNFVKLGRILLENGGGESKDKSKKDDAITALRNQVKVLLTAIAEANGKKRLLLLVDDLDRARPEEAVAILDSLYHLFMPHAEDEKSGWPLTSIWAVNTTVLEEFLYREYRELPSFEPNAYLEKLFRQRVNVPPLLHFGAKEGNSGPYTLWEASLKQHCPHFSQQGVLLPELARKLADEVNYAILGNLRLHKRVRCDCIRLWCETRLSNENRETSLGMLVREARLIVLIDAFPYFREQVAPFNGMWPHFLNQLNKRLTDRPMEWIANPLYRHVDSPDLATLLADLGVLRYDPGRACFELVPEGRNRFQRELNDFWKIGV